jgi:hypothetical protein
MADITLIVSVVIIALVLLIATLVTARRAWGNRPHNIELIPQNDSKPAGEVSLGPYIDTISKQFTEVLDN